MTDRIREAVAELDALIDKCRAALARARGDGE